MRWVILGLLCPIARLIWYMGTRALLAMLAKVCPYGIINLFNI